MERAVWKDKIKAIQEQRRKIRNKGKRKNKREDRLVYLACWLFLSALMHFPRLSREVLMFPASFSRSPLFCVLAHRSDPARSHSASLEPEYILLQPILKHNRNTLQRGFSSKHTDSLADWLHSGYSHILHLQDPDWENTVAEKSNKKRQSQNDRSIQNPPH